MLLGESFEEGPTTRSYSTWLSSDEMSPADTCSVAGVRPSSYTKKREISPVGEHPAPAKPFKNSVTDACQQPFKITSDCVNTYLDQQL